MFKSRGYSCSDALYGGAANGGNCAFAPRAPMLVHDRAPDRWHGRVCSVAAIAELRPQQSIEIRGLDQGESATQQLDVLYECKPAPPSLVAPVTLFLLLLTPCDQRTKHMVLGFLADVWTALTTRPVDRNSSIFKDVFEVAASRSSLCLHLHAPPIDVTHSLVSSPSLFRKNLLQLLTLRDNSTGRPVVLANYHMPCMCEADVLRLEASALTPLHHPQVHVSRGGSTPCTCRADLA
jgi:hypothetical protein